MTKDGRWKVSFNLAATRVDSTFRLCARGDQQIECESFKYSNLYAPTLKASEARLLAAIAAEDSCPLLKTDTRQAFLYGEMGEDEKVYYMYKTTRLVT